MLKLSFVVYVVQVLVTGQAAYRWERETVHDEGTHTTVCTQAPIELGLVVDSSGSISSADFAIVKLFLQQFLNHFDVGNGDEGVRVALISYGDGIYPEQGFNLTTYNTKEDVIAAVGAIEHKQGLRTDTGKAIKYMHDVQLTPDMVRFYAEKIVIVLTDGNSQAWVETKSESKRIRNDGVTVIAIGVGKDVRDDELNNIAGNVSMVTRVGDYAQLPSIQRTLASKTCIKKLKPTTTPAPRQLSCGELNPTDVNFIFSPASLGSEGTAWTTSFIADTIATKDMIVGFRYGVISDSCPNNEGFDLDTCSTVEEYKEYLGVYEADHMSRLMQRLSDDGFSANRGGRLDANKVAVIVASGRSDEMDGISQHVEYLNENGVKVFIADPFGKGVQVYGAVTLTGETYLEQSRILVDELCYSTTVRAVV